MVTFAKSLRIPLRPIHRIVGLEILGALTRNIMDHERPLETDYELRRGSLLKKRIVNFK